MFQRLFPLEIFLNCKHLLSTKSINELIDLYQNNKIKSLLLCESELGYNILVFSENMLYAAPSYFLADNVSIAKNLITGENVILKHGRVTNEEENRAYIKEIEILKLINRLICYKKTNETKEGYTYFMVQNILFAPRYSTLLYYINGIYNSGKKISRLHSMQILKNIVEKVQHLHDVGVVHKDLHPNNILYNSESKSAEIIDFNISAYSKSDLDIRKDVVGLYEICARPYMRGSLDFISDPYLYQIASEFYKYEMHDTLPKILTLLDEEMAHEKKRAKAIDNNKVDKKQPIYYVIDKVFQLKNLLSYPLELKFKFPQIAEDLSSHKDLLPNDFILQDYLDVADELASVTEDNFNLIRIAGKFISSRRDSWSLHSKYNEKLDTLIRDLIQQANRVQ